MKSKQEDAMSLITRLLNQLMKSKKYGEPHGAAFGLAGVIKGFGISSLKKYGVASVLREALANSPRKGILLNAVKELCWHLNVFLKSLGNYLDRKCVEDYTSYNHLQVSLSEGATHAMIS
ncbi:hypothetical protein QVD17_09404 [Tagetes erecta]|uniref:Uncharacterized protein n=1 Tax=Tagetes erecta TaxID=13708 RepID=A0AAD8L5Y1_TARER|nr:hypothetical protein QVD17_09404 [Tagetes erecta]